MSTHHDDHGHHKVGDKNGKGQVWNGKEWVPANEHHKETQHHVENHGEHH